MRFNQYAGYLLVFLLVATGFAGWAVASGVSQVPDDTLGGPTPSATLTDEEAAMGAGCCLFNIAAIVLACLVLLVIVALIVLLRYWGARKSQKREAVELAKAAKEGDVPALTHFLRNPSPEIRAKAAAAIEQRGLDALEPLLLHLQDDGTYRINASRSADRLLSVSVERMGGDQWIDVEVGSQAIPTLVSYLSVRRNDLDDVAASLLQAFGPEAVMPVAGALNDEEPSVRAKAAALLGELLDRRAIEPLITAVRDPVKIVRLEAIRALGKFDDPRAIEALKAARKDSSGEVQAAASSALSGFGGGEAPADVAFSNTFPMDFVPPTADGGTVIEREIVREVVKVPCKYCGSLVDLAKGTCPNCGAPLKP